MQSIVPELFVSDLDRTHINPDLVIEGFKRVYRPLGLDADDLEYQVKHAEELGVSYNVLDHVKSYGSSALVEEVKAMFLEDCQTNPITYSDSEELFQYLDSIFMPNILITKGEYTFQELKLKGSALDKRPYQIIDTDYKGKLIAGWQTISGLFLPPVEVIDLASRSVDLLDDKNKSFRGLPTSCKGIKIDRLGERALVSQRGYLDPRIIVIHSFREIPDYIN